MKQKLYTLSLVGWTLSTLIVFLSLFKINLIEKFPYLFILFVGIFIVGIPSVFYAKNYDRITEYEYDNNVIFNSGSVPLIPFFENAPNWILGILGLSFFTVIISFSNFFHLEGTTIITNNKYFLTNHGSIIREITKNEYQKNNLSIIRSLFGITMLFYSIPILVYKKLIEWDNNERI